MKLIINGNEKQFNVIQLTDLLSALNQPPQGIAIAVNEKIVPRQQWAKFTLSENDNVSLFQAIAGG